MKNQRDATLALCAETMYTTFVAVMRGLKNRIKLVSGGSARSQRWLRADSAYSMIKFPSSMSWVKPKARL